MVSPNLPFPFTYFSFIFQFTYFRFHKVVTPEQEHPSPWSHEKLDPGIHGILSLNPTSLLELNSPTLLPITWWSSLGKFPRTVDTGQQRLALMPSYETCSDFSLASPHRQPCPYSWPKPYAEVLLEKKQSCHATEGICPITYCLTIHSNFYSPKFWNFSLPCSCWSFFLFPLLTVLHPLLIPYCSPFKNLSLS